MRAMTISEFGATDVFQLTTLPLPQVKPGHVLIKVMATSVNPLDYKLRQGLLPTLITEFPMVLHGDVAGVITEVAGDVKDFVVGDEVYGCVGGLLGLSGALAEYVLADTALIARKPKKLDFAKAAALPLVALTAWEGLVTYAKLQAKQSILIHGGTGGVGHIAIQLAKWLGAEVYTTVSSPEKAALCQKLVAAQVINYKTNTTQDYVKQYTNGKGFDVVFDTIGGDNFDNSVQATAQFGQMISVFAFGSYDLVPAHIKGLTLHLLMQPLPLITGMNRAHYGNILKEISHLVDQDILRPLIDDKVFNIEDVALAHQHLESGKAVGKVVLMRMT